MKVWAVFDADGYECEDMAGLFSTEEKANARRDKLLAKERAYLEKIGAEGSRRRITVKEIEVQ